MAVLREHERWIYHYDLHLRPYPPTAPPTRLRDLAQRIVDMSTNNQTLYMSDNGSVGTRVADARVDDKADCLVLLLQYADQSASDPVFQQIQTGVIRVEKKQEGEGGAYSAHMLINLSETQSGSQTYHAVLESVPGLNRSHVQRYLRDLFGRIAEGWLFYGPDGDKPYRPILDLDNHASDELREGLREGELKEIKLITREVISDLDEADWVKERVHTLSTRVAPNLSFDSAISLVRLIFQRGQTAGSERMVVRFSIEGKSQTVPVDLDRTSPESALFYKYDYVQVEEALRQCSPAIIPQLEERMRTLLLQTVDALEAAREDQDEYLEEATAPSGLPADKAPGKG